MIIDTSLDFIEKKKKKIKFTHITISIVDLEVGHFFSFFFALHLTDMETLDCY